MLRFVAFCVIVCRVVNCRIVIWERLVLTCKYDSTSVLIRATILAYQVCMRLHLQAHFFMEADLISHLLLPMTVACLHCYYTLLLFSCLSYTGILESISDCALLSEFCTQLCPLIFQPLQSYSQFHSSVPPLFSDSSSL